LLNGRARIVMAAPHGGLLVPVGGVKYQHQIQNVATGMVLETVGGSREDKARVGLWNNTGGRQYWRLIPV
jgi:hypothetical protein